MKPLVIVGAGKIAYAVSQYLKDWSLYDVVAYAVDKDFIEEEEFCGRPVVALQELREQYPPSEFDAFVAMGYQQLNKLRRSKVDELKVFGYSLASIVNPRVLSDLQYGENCFIAESNAVQPGVCCGDNVFVWSGALVGHHSVLENDCWVTGGAMLAGGVKLGQGSFVGVGAQIGQDVVVGVESMIGAGTLLTKSVPDGSVLIAKSTEPYRLNSEQFLRISSVF